MKLPNPHPLLTRFWSTGKYFCGRTLAVKPVSPNMSRKDTSQALLDCHFYTTTTLPNAWPTNATTTLSFHLLGLISMQTISYCEPLKTPNYPTGLLQWDFLHASLDALPNVSAMQYWTNEK